MIEEDREFGGEAWSWHTRWQEIQQLVIFFKPFAEVTRKMSGQSYSTICNVIRYFNNILDHVDECIENVDNLGHLASCVVTAAEKAKAKLLEYYNKTNMLHCVITLLDPRCKEIYYRQAGFTEHQLGEYRER